MKELSVETRNSKATKFKVLQDIIRRIHKDKNPIEQGNLKAQTLSLGGKKGK